MVYFYLQNNERPHSMYNTSYKVIEGDESLSVICALLIC